MTMLTGKEALDYALSFPDAYQDAPFHDDRWQLVRVEGTKKTFLLVFEKDGRVILDVKVRPEWRDFWRQTFPSVIPGYHLNKEHWNTVILDGTVPDKDIKMMIAESYDLVTDTPTKRIYEAVRKIPKGCAATYQDVARLAGNPKMSRAVGNALHKNPDPEGTPCFRIVNAKGELAGAFAFGGPDVQANRLREDGIEVVDGKVDLNEFGVRILEDAGGRLYAVPRKQSSGGSPGKMKKALIFDMDGTILDTLEDLKDSMNHVLKQYGFPERTTDEIRMFVGNGIRKLVERAAPCQTDSGLIEEMYCAMLSYYREHCQVKTKPYEGIPELLKELKVLGIRTAVVSNKADAAVQTLSKQYFDGLFDVSSGAKDGMKLKPDREMCDSVLSLLKVNAKDAFYVGDSEVDIETAKNAGMDCISVSWGFRSREALSSSGARLVADKPGDVLKYVMQG